MGRPLQKTHNVIMANYGPWFAAWEVGTTYIDVFGNGSSYARVRAAFQKGENDPGSTAVHCINTTGDNTGSNPAERKAYVMAELRVWADEQGETYRANGY